MFLLRFLELLALIGLFVQTFVAWVFVAVLASIRGGGPASGAFRSFLYAFAALSGALTVMSVRFFAANNIYGTPGIWVDGLPATIVCYSLYMALKAGFCVTLTRGCHQLAGVDYPLWMSRLHWPLIVLAGLAPVLFSGIGEVLTIQAPIMIACSVAALRPLSRRSRDAGLGILRLALVGQTLTWSVHLVALVRPDAWGAHEWLSLNSFFDLGVQLMLGIGLVICLLQDAHTRVLAAEQERERMAREFQRGEKLRALGTVVSGVAHELNNPLTVILAYAEELKETLPTSRSAQVLAEQAERCRGIVRSLSALAGQAVHPHEDVDIEELARRVERGVTTGSGSDGPRLVVEPMNGLRLSVDRIGIEQVLANLIGNGLHATSPGGLVTVRAETDGGCAVISVIDRGSGIPPELRERIFEPFFTTKDPGRGSGLGLSIAHAIVRGHRGSIDVESGPDGCGTTFSVRLPLGRSSSSKAEREARRHGSGLSLLVVDDDSAVRAVVRKQAEKIGWQVAEAASAEDALSTSLVQFGAVLCDLRMPGMGGIGFHDRLRDERPELLDRVVFLTGDLASPESVAFSKRCTRPLMSKPYEPAELFGELERAAGAI